MLRNVNQLRLCNGTRLAMKKLIDNAIKATILKGKQIEKNDLISRIWMILSDLPFDFKRF